MDILNELPEDWRAPTKAWLLDMAASTQRSYRLDIRHWLTSCQDTAVDPFKPLMYQVTQYVADLKAQREPKTVARHVNCLSSWFRYLGECQLVEANPFLGRARGIVKNRHYSTTRYLSEAQDRALVEAARNWAVPMRLRNVAIITLMATLGIRVGEVVKLRIDQITTLGEHRVLPVKGKGGVMVDRAVPGPVEETINAYLAWRAQHAGVEPAALTGLLFTTESGRAVDESAIFRLVQDLAALAGIPHPKTVTPHALRHTFATIATERGADLDDLQDAMGHADPTTTRGYQHRTQQLANDPAHLLAEALG